MSAGRADGCDPTQLRTEARTGRVLLALVRYCAITFAVADMVAGFTVYAEGNVLTSSSFKVALGWASPTVWGMALVVIGFMALAPHWPIRAVGLMLTAFWYATWGSALVMSGAPGYAALVYGQLVVVHALLAIISASEN